jgi:preprotein translocase subunit SecY
MHNRSLIKRCLWTLLLVLILAAGQQIVLPSIDGLAATQALTKQGGSFLQIFGSVTGGRLTVPALFSLGLSPYMTSMIVWSAVQSLDLPGVSAMSVRAIGMVQRFFTLIIASLQALAMVRTVAPALQPMPLVLGDYSYDMSAWFTGIILVAGAMFTAWLADLNNDKGIGSTVIMIVPGIIINIPGSLQRGWGGVTYALTPQHIAVAAVVAVLFTFCAVWLYKIEVRLPLQRPMLESSYGDSYIPIKLLTAGAMPFMFSTSLFSLPMYVVKGTSLNGTPMGHAIMQWTSYQSWRGLVLYAVVLMLLGYAFGYLNTRPVQTAKSLKYSSDYFYDVAPGDATERFLTHHFFVICTLGNLVEIVIGIVPLLLENVYPGAANFSLFLGNLFIIVTIFDTIMQQFRALRSKYQYQLFA